MVAHMEFFYNTRAMSHNTPNPFTNISAFPALLYKPEEHPEETIYQVHKRITFPRQGLLKIDINEDVSMSSSQISLVSPIDKRYDWYPNRDISSPVSQFAKSPSPMKLKGNKDFRRGTVMPG